MSEDHANRFAADLTEAAAAFRAKSTNINLAHSTHDIEGFAQLVTLVTELAGKVNDLAMRDALRAQEIADLRTTMAKLGGWAKHASERLGVA